MTDAKYIVYHKGEATEFSVNQRMGGGTWVYLGTFDFDKGCNTLNRVVVTNQASKRGVVTSDAVRFGGGMGNILRGNNSSVCPAASKEHDTMHSGQVLPIMYTEEEKEPMTTPTTSTHVC